MKPVKTMFGRDMDLIIAYFGGWGLGAVAGCWFAVGVFAEIGDWGENAVMVGRIAPRDP
jgi:hypothetical protein